MSLSKIFLFIAVIAYMNRVKLMDAAIKLDSKWSKLNPEVKPRALQVLDAANRVFADTGYTVHIFDGWRPVASQQGHIESGASFVNDALRSYHVWGLAVDFVFKDSKGNWTWEPGADCAIYDLSCHGTRWYWDKLGEQIEAAGFEWGGRWRTFDGPHAQLTTLGRTSALIASYGEPTNQNGFA